MPCVSRVDSYSHVRDCGSYQPRIEGSWPSGMYGVPQFGWEWTSIGTSIWASNVPQLSQDELTVTGHSPCQCRPSLGLGSGRFSAWAPQGPTVPLFFGGKGAAAHGLHLWRNVAETPLIEPRKKQI